jgi:hypothetical protein
MMTYNKCMRLRALLFVLPILFGFAVFAAPASSFAQVQTPAPESSPSFFGPLIPRECNCDTGATNPANGETAPVSAADWGCVFATIQNAVKLAVALGILVVTLAIAYAGFLFMTSGGSEERRSKGKQAITNALIGLVIVLTAWLIVDTLMKVIYNANASSGSVQLGPWNAIITGDGPKCILPQKAPTVLQTVQQLGNTNSNTSGGINPNAPLSTSGSGACNAVSITNAAAGAGIRMPSGEANTLACLAGPESSCGTVNKNYNWDAAVKPPPSTAWGPFQILLKTNSQCFDNPTCSAAAGVSGNLNCASAFTSAGYSIPGTKLAQCQRAAANFNCSVVAAHCVYTTQGGKAWTKDPNNAKQKACLAGN